MYKIEIWQFHSIVDTFTSNKVEEVLKWYIGNWAWFYDNGLCAFYVYKDGEEISNEEFYKFGFGEIYF